MVRDIIILSIVCLVAISGLVISSANGNLSGQAVRGRLTINEDFRAPPGMVALIDASGRVSIIDPAFIPTLSRQTIIDPLFRPQGQQKSIIDPLFKNNQRAIIDPSFMPQPGQLTVIDDQGRVSSIDIV